MYDSYILIMITVFYMPFKYKLPQLYTKRKGEKYNEHFNDSYILNNVCSILFDFFKYKLPQLNKII